jgi:hypothetical protein
LKENGIECTFNGDTKACQKHRREHEFVMLDRTPGAVVTGVGKIIEKIGEENEITPKMFDNARYMGIGYPDSWTDGPGIYIMKDWIEPAREPKKVYLVHGAPGNYEVLFA